MRIKMDSKSLVFLAKDNLDFAKLGLKTSSDFKKFKSDPTLENTDFPKNVSNWSLYVIPIFTVLHRLFLYPHTIRYDPEQRKCLKHNGSLPRRIITGVINTFVIIHLLTSTFGSQASNSALAVMYGIMYTCFTTFSIAVFHFGWAKLDQVVDLLNEISTITEYMGSFGVPIKCRNREKALIYCSVTVAAIFSILYALVALNQNAVWKTLVFASQHGWSDLGEGIYENVTLPQAMVLVGKFTPNNSFLQIPTPTPSLASVSRPFVCLLGIIQQIIDLYNCFYWVFTFCGLFLWGVFFGRLFQIFVVKVKLCDTFGSGVLQDIHDFARLTTILDKWNGIYGGITFMATLSGILSGTVTAGEVVLNRKEGSAFESLINLGAMLPLLLVLGAGSRVNYLAGEYGTILKGQYLEQRFPQGMNAGLSHGLAIVFHQIQTNSVGIQGAGFFTISYSFIGTVVSVMATYAVVILQWGAADGIRMDQ